MRLAAVVNPILSNPFKFFDDPFDAVIQKTGEMQVTEGIHKVQLLLGELELGHRYAIYRIRCQSSIVQIVSRTPLIGLEVCFNLSFHHPTAP